MKRKMLEDFYDKMFVPGLIASLSFIGYILYNQGKADAIHEIYENGWSVVDLKDEEKEK